MGGYQPGISVILASSGGVRYIERALASLAAQTLESSFFEILFCLNGEDDGTRIVIDTFQHSHPDINLRVLHSPIQGLAHARNIGLLASSYSNFTILDDDDWVSPQYLEKLLKACSRDIVVMTYICDISSESDQQGDHFSNYLNRGILPYSGQLVQSSVVPVGSADGGKAASTILACNVLYDEDLRSGLDVIFWSKLVARYKLKVRILGIREHAIYYRRVRSESMSRLINHQYIEDRFRVVDKLRVLRQSYPDSESLLSRSLSGQAALLGEVAQKFPNIYHALSDRFQLTASQAEIAAFNHSAANTLATCYVYTPYNDASAIVAAKRLAQSGEPFDVISHNMAPIRTVDQTTLGIDSEFLGRHVLLSGPPSSTSWYRLAEFCKQGANTWERLTKGRNPYEKVYSRAQWPFSHALAALIKSRQPEIQWIAEFSDPISIDIDGNDRPGAIGEFPERTEIDDAVHHAGFNTRTLERLNEWIELIAYALADEIIFTNDNQKIFMISKITDALLSQRANQHSVIAMHPPVPNHLLRTLHPPIAEREGKIHLGYYGRYYKERGVEDVLIGLEQLPRKARKKILFHFYAPEKQLSEVRHHVRTHYRGSNIIVRKQLDYIEFLQSAKSMDWLLIVDSKVSALHGINPYFPSKYSEYSSLGVKIWGIVEPGSTLSRSRLDAISISGNPDDAERVLRQILEIGGDLNHPQRVV